MRRLPNWLFIRLERVYLAEERARRREVHDRAQAQDRALRDWADRMREAHHQGTCGGAAAGCPFVPCVPRVS